LIVEISDIDRQYILVLISEVHDHISEHLKTCVLLKKATFINIKSIRACNISNSSYLFYFSVIKYAKAV